ncbi:signal peptidase II [Escherichia coli]
MRSRCSRRLICIVARNDGAAFSFLADSGGWQCWFFAGIAIGISVILAVMMYRSKATQKLNNIAYALIIGGALATCSTACGTASLSI